MPPPELYSPDLALKVCEQIALGKSLRTIAASDEMPAISTIYKWIDKAEGFAEQYARAKQDASDMLVEEMLEIADSLEEDANSRRIRVDTRKWIASKLKPKVYGDRIEQRISDGEGNALVFRVEDARVPKEKK